MRAKQQAITTADLSTEHLDYTDMSFDNNEFADRQESYSEEELLLKQERCLKRNYLEISCAAAAASIRFGVSSTATAASIRFGMSSTATAAIINGLLVDLVKAGHSVEDKKPLICDCKKVFRAKERAIKC